MEEWSECFATLNVLHKVHNGVTSVHKWHHNGEFMQQYHSVIQYNAITLSDYAYKLQFVNSAKWQDTLNSSRIIVQIYVISISFWN